MEASNQELSTKLNRLQVEFDATKQIKHQFELKCKELDTEKKELERASVNLKKNNKADKSKDGKCPQS